MVNINYNTIKCFKFIEKYITVPTYFYRYIYYIIINIIRQTNKQTYRRMKIN